MNRDEAIKTLTVIISAVGAGLAVCGVLKMCAGYAEHSPEMKLQGINGIMAGIALLEVISDLPFALYSLPAVEGRV